MFCLILNSFSNSNMRGTPAWATKPKSPGSSWAATPRCGARTTAWRWRPQPGRSAARAWRWRRWRRWWVEGQPFPARARWEARYGHSPGEQFVKRIHHPQIYHNWSKQCETGPGFYIFSPEMGGLKPLELEVRCLLLLSLQHIRCMLQRVWSLELVMYLKHDMGVYTLNGELNLGKHKPPWIWSSTVSRRSQLGLIFFSHSMGVLHLLLHTARIFNMTAIAAGPKLITPLHPNGYRSGSVHKR